MPSPSTPYSAQIIDSSKGKVINGTLNLKKAVTKYSDRPNNASPSPNFMRMTQSYLNNVNDSRGEEVIINTNNISSLNTSGLLNKSYLSNKMASHNQGYTDRNNTSQSRKKATKGNNPHVFQNAIMKNR